MSEIKFRWFSNWSKKYYYDGFVVFADGSVEFPEAGWDLLGHKETDGFLEQYTGLKDKNGKDIYEGDILKGGIYSEYIVTWEENGWNIHPDNICHFEIIGNIHEEAN